MSKAIENHPNDSRVKIADIFQALTERMGTGGGNTPMVLEDKAFGLDRAAYNQGKNATFDFSVEEEKIGSQIAKGPGAVCTKAIVRRLTVTECARLQGFPDWWCDGLDEPNPTDEEMAFWREVFDTYSDVTGASKKTDKAIAKWLEHPHSDSAEYKMWGNGVALPCVEYIMGRIAQFEGQDEYHPVDAQWCRGGRKSTMICCGFDAYNQASTGSVSKSLTNKATDSDHTPVVAVEDCGFDVYNFQETGVTTATLRSGASGSAPLGTAVLAKGE